MFLAGSLWVASIWIKFLELCFFCDFSSLLEPCGLHFRGPGHPRAALGSILAPLVPKADSRGSVGRPFWRLWAPFGLQVGRQSASKRKAAFRSHILSINLDVILSDFSVFLLKIWISQNMSFLEHVFYVFFLCLERFEAVKYSKNRVGSFKNTMYRKSKKINPRLDFS